MSGTREQIPPLHKRQHTEAGLSLDDPSELQPSKRLKSGTKLHSAAFYDSLSKVWLTRRALKELDRRTTQAKSPQRPASARRQEHREDTWTKQIQRFARHGGPELCDLRGYPAPTDVDIAHAMSSNHCSRSSGSRQSKSTAPTSRPSSRTSNRRSSAYDKDFEQHLTDHHIYIRNRKSKPRGLEELYQRLPQLRPSLSPSRFSNNAFESFQQKNEDVIDEGEVMRDVVPIIAGNADILSKQDLLFTRLDSIANDTTVDAKPDFYDGACLDDIDKKVRGDIGNYIIPTGHATAPVAPNFFLEVKRPNGGADVAKRQACYNGALGARGMHQLQSYREEEPIYDGNAYTITSTYHDGQLKMYTTHPTRAEGSRDSTAYHMTQVNTWGLTGNPDSFRQGATAFRNARDWAQQQRDGFISAANERARAVCAEPPPFESSDHKDVSDPKDLQDTTHLIQAEDLGDDSQYYVSKHPFHPESSTFAPSDYNGYSDTTNAYPAEESETSPDELALDTYETTSNKRRNRASGKAVSKAPRVNDSTRRRHRSKK